MDVRLRPKQSSRPWVQLAKLLTSHSAEEMKELTTVPPGSPWADATPSAPANATSRIASLDAPTIQGGSFGLLVLRPAPQCRRDLLQSNLHVSFPSPAEPRPLSHSYAVSPRLATHPSRQLALPTQPSSATERHLDLPAVAAVQVPTNGGASPAGSESAKTYSRTCTVLVHVLVRVARAN